jgi:hypothetical protein
MPSALLERLELVRSENFHVFETCIQEANCESRSTQLYIIDQAREPANFFQALGGIVITRRGSRAESLKEPYMLCGRPHMGHIAFDEVNRSKSSLCSEYPYIIARPITLQVVVSRKLTREKKRPHSLQRSTILVK